MKPRWGWTLAFYCHLGAMGAAVTAGKGFWLVGVSISLLVLVQIEARRVRRVYPIRHREAA